MHSIPVDVVCRVGLQHPKHRDRRCNPNYTKIDTICRPALSRTGTGVFLSNTFRLRALSSGLNLTRDIFVNGPIAILKSKDDGTRRLQHARAATRRAHTVYFFDLERVHSVRCSFCKTDNVIRSYGVTPSRARISADILRVPNPFRRTCHPSNRRTVVPFHSSEFNSQRRNRSLYVFGGDFPNTLTSKRWPIVFVTVTPQDECDRQQTKMNASSSPHT